MDIKVSISDEPVKSTSIPLGFAKDDTFAAFPIYIRWSVKISIVILAGLIILMGVLTALDLVFRCIFGGIILILSGLVIIVFEAPFLCTFVTFTQPLVKASEKFPNWIKMFIYSAPGIVEVLLCRSVAAIFGSIFCFLIAGAYFVAFMTRKPKEDGFDNIGSQNE